MYDMLALAYQANITRVFTFMVAREESNGPIRRSACRTGTTQRRIIRIRPEKLEKLVKIQNYHVSCWRGSWKAEEHAGWRRHRCWIIR